MSLILLHQHQSPNKILIVMLSHPTPYSTSSILDKHGKRIVNTRRRYEDSNGRLKAIHDREIDGKKIENNMAS